MSNIFYIRNYFHCQVVFCHIVIIVIESIGRLNRSLPIEAWQTHLYESGTPGKTLSDFGGLAYKRPSYLTSIQSVREHSYCAYAVSDSMPTHIEWELVQRAVRLRVLWHSQKTIAYMFGMTQGAFSKILRRYRETGNTGPQPCSGRPWFTTDRKDCSLVRMQLRSCFQSAPSLRTERETAARRPPLVRTVRWSLASLDIRVYRPTRVPALKWDHCRSCRRWNHDHRNLQVGHWRHCVLAPPPPPPSVLPRWWMTSVQEARKRLHNDHVNATHGNWTASVMVWGAIHRDTKSELMFINGTLNRFQYVDILSNSMVPFAKTTFKNNFVLVHDSAIFHTAHHTRDFLTQEQVEVMAKKTHWIWTLSNTCATKWGRTSMTWPTHLPIRLSCDRLSNKPEILWHWKISSTWSTACPVIWLCCRPPVVATPNIKSCTRKIGSWTN